MDSSSVALRADLSVRDRNRTLSRASDALDINSLRKICTVRSHDNHMTSSTKGHKKGYLFISVQ